MNARNLFWPLTIIYGGIVTLRNTFYNKNVFKSSQFDKPILLVGNLSMGGTGKTPHIEYLIRLLKNNYQIATLSRGYGRRLPGFHEVLPSHKAEEIGDEPLQFKSKFQDICVYVGEKRVDSVMEILSQKPDTEVILLDDAFQHRAIKAGFNVLLTKYNEPFFDDYILPVGNLREKRKEAKRADIIIVTKCPENLSLSDKNLFIHKLKPYFDKEIYFSRISYDATLHHVFENKKITFDSLNDKNLLITGIENPSPLIQHLKNKKIDFEHLKYRDHYKFKESDISKILNIFAESKKDSSVIITTEKDAMRLKSFDALRDLPIYYVGISIDIIDEKEKFETQIKDYVRSNKGISEVLTRENE